jgi:excisionase family DNA binding protein
MQLEEMLTPQEVAAYLKVPLQTIWRWCREGTVPAVKIGRYWRVPSNDLAAFIAARRSKPIGQSSVEECR